ncbi:hypothetical protein G6721_01800 [Polynucleobacter paneuropaeus]|nr:hypothetical protein [Polynucleobacter paneuropaeus]
MSRMHKGICMQCGYMADVTGACPKCQQLELLQKQTKIMEDSQRRASNQSSGGRSWDSRDTQALGGLIKLGFIAGGLYLAYLFVMWLWGLTVAVATWIWGVVTWIWNVVTWPFRFTWQSFENVIVGSTNLVGINHDPAWWETLILIGVIIFAVSFVSVLQPVNKEGDQEKAKSNLEAIKIGIIALIAIGVIACGIWVNPPAKVNAPAVTTKVEETAPEQKVEATSQEQAQSVPVATPVEALKAPVAVAPASPVADNTLFAPSFDCAKASNNAEKMICGDRNLSKLDVQLSQAYSAARDKSADKAQLKSEQIAWVKTSRACPDTACLTKALQDRIKQLSN